MNNTLDAVMGLRGKRVVLSGANGLLGIHYLKNYLALGLNVAAVDYRVDRLARLKARYKRQLTVVEADISDADGCHRAFKSVLAGLGGLDAVHHNCTSKPDGFNDITEDYGLDAWRGVMSGNVETAFLLTQSVIPYFKKRRAGTFLFTGSIYGVVAPDPRIYGDWKTKAGKPINSPASYSTAKAAIIGLAKHLSVELAPWNIRVNSITPGGVESGQQPAFQKRYSYRAPLGRMADAQELVGPALFLLSDSASYVTGHNLVVDGGWTAW
jgi:NAD(P)-dependent dehydrogenase (short-subunit alcohol dehydrogenase family)